MIDLITGHQGLPHITAEQVSTINDIFMYGYGENTIVRLLDGTISQDGRAIVISEGYWRANGYDMQITEDETIAFDPTEAGVSRIDVVYAEILQDIPTGNQRTEFVVIQGTPDVSPSEPPVPSGAPLTTDDLILAIPVAKCTISENTLTFVDETIPLSDGNVEDINEQLEAIRNVYGSKNLLKNNVNSFAGSGLIVATSTDGTFLVTGTSTAGVYINIQNWTDAVSIKAGTKLFCSFSDDNSVTYTPIFEVQHSDYTTKSYTIPPGGLEFTAEKDIIKINAGIDIDSGIYMGPNGFIFKPMLCLACMNDGVYAPYAETNRQLTTDLGSKNDAADSSGSAFARIANLLNNLGTKTDAASSTGSAFARIKDLQDSKINALMGQGDQYQINRMYWGSNSLLNVEMKNSAVHYFYDKNKIDSLFTAENIKNEVTITHSELNASVIYKFGKLIYVTITIASTFQVSDWDPLFIFPSKYKLIFGRWQIWIGDMLDFTIAHNGVNAIQYRSARTMPQITTTLIAMIE